MEHSVTTLPAPPARPRDDVASLDAESKAIFARAAETYASPTDKMQLLAYLTSCDWDEDIAHEKMEDIEVVKRAPRPPLEDVLRFYGNDGAMPRPYVACLEDGRGGCARAHDNSPIVVGYGKPDGTNDEIIAQINFALERAARYVAESEMPIVTFVTDLIPRQALHQIESPNMTVGNHMQKFPLTFRSYTCGMQEWMVRASEKFKPLVPQHIQDKYKFSADYSVLDGVASPDNMLPAWHPDGRFDFDVDKYVAYLRATAGE